MSRRSSQEKSVTIGDTEVLTVVREECSPAESSVNINLSAENKVKAVCKSDLESCDCNIKTDSVAKRKKSGSIQITVIKNDDENILRTQLGEQHETEIRNLKEKFNYILENEQIRASHMLREAHRERQEKILALQTQLECKNLAALMCVLATERRKSRLEKLRIIQDYSNHIVALQSLLSEAQTVILDLSRGYKTAARVDHEWRQKMQKVIYEFQNFVYCFAGGEEVFNQYFFDLPALLSTKTPIVNNPEEDPCECEEIDEELEKVEEPEVKPWYERMDSDCRPFVMFGDMGEFKPPQRREVLKAVKAAKSAPKQWKEYVFNEMTVTKHCSNLDSIKDVYMNHVPHSEKMDYCTGTLRHRDPSVYKIPSTDSIHRGSNSTDNRGTMGSIIKMITAVSKERSNGLLAAKDSKEIISSCKLMKSRLSQARDTLDGDRKKSSLMQDLLADESEMAVKEPTQLSEERSLAEPDEEKIDFNISGLCLHHDSLQVIRLEKHEDVRMSKIQEEKVCPMEKCQRLQVDSFMRSLPPYMRANPFTYFDQSYEDYETCSPEQLKLLKERIEIKKKRERQDYNKSEPDPLEEWKPEVGGVAVQTSWGSLDSAPACTCRAPSPSYASSTIRVFDVEALCPAKALIDDVNLNLLHDSRVQLDRFMVVGEKESDYNRREREEYRWKRSTDRMQEIKNILHQYPSLCDLFQANTRC